MQTSKRTLLFSIIIGVIVFCGCAIVYLFVSQPLTGSAPPDDNEPVGAAPTEPLPSELPTSAVPDSTPQPALPERRRLTLEFPPQIRAGDSDVVRLTLEVDDLGSITPTAEIGWECRYRRSGRNTKPLRNTSCDCGSSLRYSRHGDMLRQICPVSLSRRDNRSRFIGAFVLMRPASIAGRSGCICALWISKTAKKVKKRYQPNWSRSRRSISWVSLGILRVRRA